MQGVVIMTTQTSLIAQQTRIQEWAEQVRDCQSRPKGMDVESKSSNMSTGKQKSPHFIGN